MHVIQTHTIKNQDQGGREVGGVTEMPAVLSWNEKTQKTLYIYTQTGIPTHLLKIETRV